VNATAPQLSPPSMPFTGGARGTPASALSPRELLLVDAIAERVAELLRPESSRPSVKLVDAQTVARALGVSDKSVYRHAAELGAVRVGRRLRFDLERALASWPVGKDDRSYSEKSQPPQSPTRTRGSDSRQALPETAHCRLLPVGRGNRSE
jgi:hypothetical protein